VSEPVASESRPLGTIHDLGYKRYVGTRRATSTRWRVIARNQFAYGWKTWWRFKSALGLAVITMFVAGGIMFIARERVVRSMAGADGSITFANATLPGSIEWFCRVGFLVSLTIGARAVAGDIQSGAFTFYFARSVRPRDYVLGKLAGLCGLLVLLVGVGPILLAVLRLGLSDSTDQLLASLPLLGKAVLVGALATLAYAAIPLGFSAAIPNQRYSMALWATYYLVLGSMARGMADVFNQNAIAAIDIPAALQSVGYELFDVTLLRAEHANVPLGVALVSLFAHAFLAIVLVVWRVGSAQKSGVGGSS
jgi:ABC-type transport system involved in multi-copper enzyme maturation permease subunit